MIRGRLKRWCLSLEVGIVVRSRDVEFRRIDRSILTRLDHSLVHEIVNHCGVVVYSCKHNALGSWTRFLNRVKDGRKICKSPFLREAHRKNPLRLGILTQPLPGLVLVIQGGDLIIWMSV